MPVDPQRLPQDARVLDAFRRLEEAIVYEQDGRCPSPRRDATYAAFVAAVCAAHLDALATGEESLSIIAAYKATNTDPEIHGASWDDVGRIFDVLNLEHRAFAGALRAKLAAAESDVGRLGEQLAETVAAFRTRLAAAEARVKELEGALEKYGMHEPPCDPNAHRVCDCGLDAALGRSA